MSQGSQNKNNITSERICHNVFNSLEDIMIIISDEFIIEDINAIGLCTLEKKRGDVIDRHCSQVLYKGNCEEGACPLTMAKKSGKAVSLQKYVEDFDRFYSIKCSPVKDEAGGILKFVILMRDITEEKKVQAELEASELKYRSLFDNINVGAALHEIIVDQNGKPMDFIFLDANQAYEKMTYLKKDEIMHKRGRTIIPNLEQKWLDIYGDVALNGKSVSIIEHSKYLDRYWEVRAYSPAKNQFAVAMIDVTSRIRTEKALQTTLAKNENLLKELQHRVKNSFSLISGMIDLMKSSESRRTTDEALSELQVKVRAVSDMYRLLSRGDGALNISLDDYVDRLLESFPMPKHIIINFCRDKISMPASKAVSIGLILAELLTNSLKHAFDGVEFPVIRIEMKRDEDICEMQYSDNGRGLDDDFEIESSDTLGMSIIRSLVVQIGGGITIDHKKGFSCKILVSALSD